MNLDIDLVAQVSRGEGEEPRNSVCDAVQCHFDEHERPATFRLPYAG